MEKVLSKWMGLAITAVVIVALVWGVLLREMSIIVNSITTLFGGS